MYRVTNSSRFGLPEAIKGEWAIPAEVRLRYNEFADNHVWDIRLRFGGERLTAYIVDRAGSVAAMTAVARRVGGGGRQPWTGRCRCAIGRRRRDRLQAHIGRSVDVRTRLGVL